MVTTVTSSRPTPLLGHYERELYMTSHDSNPPKTVVNIDKLAIVNDARKIVEVVLNLAIEANRGLSAEECEVLAAVTVLSTKVQTPVLNTCMKAPVQILLTKLHRRNKNMKKWDY